eukprot:1154627-Pelagomonas_calceolata.AAC.2
MKESAIAQGLEVHAYGMWSMQACKDWSARELFAACAEAHPSNCAKHLWLCFPDGLLTMGCQQCFHSFLHAGKARCAVATGLMIRRCSTLHFFLPAEAQCDLRIGCHHPLCFFLHAGPVCFDDEVSVHDAFVVSACGHPICRPCAIRSVDFNIKQLQPQVR